MYKAKDKKKTKTYEQKVKVVAIVKFFRLMKNSIPQYQVIWVHVIAVIYTSSSHCNDLYMLRKAE